MVIASLEIQSGQFIISDCNQSNSRSFELVSRTGVTWSWAAVLILACGSGVNLKCQLSEGQAGPGINWEPIVNVWRRVSSLNRHSELSSRPHVRRVRQTCSLMANASESNAIT